MKPTALHFNEQQEVYNKLLLHTKWELKRKEILEHDGRKCKCCGSKNNLQIHHRQYHTNPQTGMYRNPWEYENKYLVTFCNNCHIQGHSKYKVPHFTY